MSIHWLIIRGGAKPEKKNRYRFLVQNKPLFHSMGMQKKLLTIYRPRSQEILLTSSKHTDHPIDADPICVLSLKSLGFSGLGANPVEAIIHDTGLWGIRFLMITLLITPIAYYSGNRSIAKLGKPVGLMAFFYVLNHFLSYALIDQADLGVIMVDIIETPI